MIAIQRTYMSLGILILSVIICCASETVSVDVPANSRCLAKKYKSLLNSSDDIEDLNIDVPMNIAFDVKQKKRFVLFLNSPGPLYITFSQNVSRSIYFNQTTNLSRNLKPDLREILLPCALSGQYDLFVRARQRGSIKVEAHAEHPKSNWNLLNQTKQINIRSQNRVGKRQMVIKWTRSKSDVHAVNFCLVINAKRPQTNFCTAVNDFVVGSMQKGNCFTGSWTNYIWKPERVKEIDPQITNVICTGSRTQQVLRQLIPNTTYFVDIFGVHTRRDNLTFHIVTKEIKFERTHPKSLRENALTVEKISGLSTVSIVSFKVPADSIRSPSTPQLRYLILPCGGSEVNAKVLKQGKVVAQGHGIYKPTYINVNNAQPGGRYIIRINASNDDEVLRANKVGLAVTTGRTFANLPELPENITVFEIRSRKTCKSATIAWYASPETRPIRYCIRVYNTNRCSVDSTNYCMDFRKSIKDNRQFYEMGCLDRSKPPKQIETYDIFNLTPGSRYLFYVTVRLLDGRPLPYQSLPVRISHQCHNELYDSRESTAYY